MRQAMMQATRKATRSSGGRPVPLENLHVTLAFLGSVREEQLPELAGIARHAAASRLGGGALAFGHLEYWRAAQLLCALPMEPPAWAAALARGLQDLLARRGFAPDLKPFRPHLTVARQVSRPGRIPSMQPVVWSFTAIALIESRTRSPGHLPSRVGLSEQGPLYSVVESLPLCGGIAKSAEPSNAENNSEKP